MMNALPPGPRWSLPHLLEFMRDPEGCHLRAAKRWGDPFTAPLPRMPMVVTGRPDVIRRMFAAPADTLGIITVDSPLIGPNSIVRLEGDAHARARALLAPVIKAPIRHDGGAGIFDVARRVAEAAPLDRPIRLEDVASRVSLEIVLRAVFGEPDPDEIEAFVAAYRVFTAKGSFVLHMTPALQIDLGRFSPWGKVMAARTVLDRLIHRRIKAAFTARNENGGEATDLLTRIVQEGDPADPLLSTAALYDQLHIMLHAGHASTSNAIAWALAWAHALPGMKDRLLEELGTDPTPEAVLRLPLLNAFCRETLRIHPVAPMVGRLVKQDFEVAGHVLPAGTKLAASVILAHLNPEVWEAPETFRPERFLDGHPDPGTWLPFGGGSRKCLGMSLALIEMKLVLAAFLPRLNVELASPTLPRSVITQMLAGPKHGVKAVLRRRGK